MEKKRDKMKDYMKAKQVHMGKKNCCLFFNFLYVIKTLQAENDHPSTQIFCL